MAGVFQRSLLGALPLSTVFFWSTSYDTAADINLLHHLEDALVSLSHILHDEFGGKHVGIVSFCLPLCILRYQAGVSLELVKSRYSLLPL